MKGQVKMKKDILEQIYQKYHRALFLYAFSLCQNRHDAEDLVSESFVKAFLSYKEGSGNIKNWLLVVLKNQFINEYKRKKRIVDYPIEIIEDPYDALKHYIKEDEKRWMYAQIYHLKEPERSVLLLTIQFRLKDEEIANYLHLSVANVRLIRYRAKQILKELARKEGYI